MKKLLMAVAAFGMLLTSCAKDDTVAPVEDKEALVSFCVNSPAVATRYGEGETAQDLYYAVYDTQEGYVAGLSKVDGTVEIKTSTTVNLNLVQGRSYEVIFWAQAEGAPYTFAEGMKADEATMTINDVTALVANNEAYDAFYAYVEPIEVKGAVSQTVELKRPFAQLNVATADTALASTAGVDIATTGVEVAGVYSSFNLKSGAVTGNATTAKFAPTAKAKGTIKANGKEYDHIAMNYLLVNAKKLVDVTLTLAEANTTTPLTRKYTSVPVQRNYRTNIIGNILTSTADFNVEIKPGFVDEDVPFTGADALRLAAIEGGEFTLEEDIVADGPIAVPEGVTFVLDLNGHTITVASGNAIQNKGTLIIKGNVTTRTSGVASIISESTYGVNNSGTLTVDGVKVNAIYNSGELTFNDGIVENTISGRHGIYHCGSKLVINNGTFSSTSGNELIRATSANTTTINGGTFTQLGKSYLLGIDSAAIVINGGTFNGYVNDNGTNDKMRTGSAVVKGGTFNFDPTAWVAEGYKAMEKDGKYVVVPEEVDAIASNNTELAAAIADNATIVLAAGTYIIPDEAKGKTLTIQGTGNPEDVVLAAQDDGGAEGDCDYSFDGATVTFDGVTITTTSTYFPGYARMKGTYNNCIINGVYTTYDSSSFTDCTFNVSGDLYNLWTWGAETVELTNCTFNCDGKAVLLYGTANTKLTVNNCTFNDNGSISGKAAIETGNDYNKSYELTVNNTTVNGFDINPNGYNTGTTLWANKNSMSPANLKVTVDGKDAYKVVVADAAGLNSAIAAGVSTIALAAGEYTFPASSLKEGVTIKCEEGTVFTGTSSLNIKGATVEGATFSNPAGQAVSGTINGNFKDCTFEGSEALRWCYTEAGKTSVFENCVIKTNFRGFHFDNMEGDVIFRNCEINGFNAYGGDGTATFEGCTFGNDGSSYNGLNIYANTVLKGCTFNFISGKTNFIDMEGTGKTLTIEGCTATLDGATTEISNYVGGSMLAQNTVIYK